MIDSQQFVPNGESSDAPAATTNGDNYFLAWKGASDASISWTSSPASSGQNSYDWKPPQKLKDVGTSAGPALASLKNTPWLAWKGEGTDTRIFVSSHDGSNWSGGVALPKIGTSAAPALAATDGELLVAFKGESDSQLFVATSPDGKTWGEAAAVKGALSSDTPALAAFKGTVYLVYKAANAALLWWASRSPAGEWSEAVPVPGLFLTNVGPAAAVGDSGLLHVAIKAPGDDSILTGRYDPGSRTWSLTTVIPVIETSTRPALAFQGSAATDVLLAWKGKDTKLAVGPLDALATEQVQTYTFAFNQFKINNTRSGDIFSIAKDTDYASFGLTVGKGKPQVLSQAMGNLSNGNYPTDLAFRNVRIADDDNVILSYHIINNSQGGSVAIADLEAATEKLATAGATALASAAGAAIGTAIGAALGTAIPVPLVGSALGALAGWLVGTIWNGAFPNCDGPVASAIHIFTGAELRTMTATGQYVSNEDNPGVTSQDGCGTNSDYVVTWSVAAG